MEEAQEAPIDGAKVVGIHPALQRASEMWRRLPSLYCIPRALPIAGHREGPWACFLTCINDNSKNCFEYQIKWGNVWGHML